MIPTIYWSYYEPKVINNPIRHKIYRSKYNGFSTTLSRITGIPRLYSDYPGGYIIGTWNIILSMTDWLLGSTVLVEPWPPSRPSSSHLFCVHVSSARVAPDDQTVFCLYKVPEQCCFSGVRLLASRPTPNLEDQGVSLHLGSTLRPVRHGRPY
jgi:hypothetical protein